jgi:hypothetical protein
MFPSHVSLFYLYRTLKIEVRDDTKNTGSYKMDAIKKYYLLSSIHNFISEVITDKTHSVKHHLSLCDQTAYSRKNLFDNNPSLRHHFIKIDSFFSNKANQSLINHSNYSFTSDPLSEGQDERGKI